MDATIMPSTASVLLRQLKKDYPSIAFIEGVAFAWTPLEKIISYQPSDAFFAPLLLHELAHAVLKHSTYEHDIELVAMERSAWDYAREKLGPAYRVPVEDDFVNEALDTYRDWLHARSICPDCHATGIQHKDHEYICVACHNRWRVNEARVCSLRRYHMKKTR